MASHGGIARSATVVAVTVAMIGAVAPTAVAAVQKEVAGFIGGARGVGTGGLFTEPSDIAVYRGPDGTRKLFVVEAPGERNARVQRLDRHGNFELAWGRDVVRRGARGDTGKGYEVCRAAVSGAAGCKAAPAGDRAGELRMPTAIAVNDASGDVYVLDRGNRRVQRYSHDGRFLAAWGWGVSTARARFEVCTGRCRAGVTGASGSAAGQFGDSDTSAAIAVDPTAPYHVFAGDEGNNRILEFKADGVFVRGWGWGVRTGGRDFEACTVASGCRRGRPHGRDWPRHLAIDVRGVVYASGTGSGGIERFVPGSRDGHIALLAPLVTGKLLSGDDVVLGVAVDHSDQTLAVAQDPFGPPIVDEVSHPAAPSSSADSRPAPTAVVQKGLPYIESINGIDAHDETIYLAKSTNLYPIGPSTAFNHCPAPDQQPRICNGIVALAPPAPLIATTLTASSIDDSTAILAAAIVAGGIARYHFQISRDGRTWKDLTRPRYTSGSHYASITTAITGLEPNTVYRTRIQTTRTPDDEPDISNPALLVTPRR